MCRHFNFNALLISKKGIQLVIYITELQLFEILCLGRRAVKFK